jgi:uncharacterized protein (DUF2336 family)
MTLLILLLAVMVISVTAPFLGRDSRSLDDEHNEVPWDRLPS